MLGFACLQGWAFLHKENQGKKGQIPAGKKAEHNGLASFQRNNTEKKEGL
jgi:hypothetical protein